MVSINYSPLGLPVFDGGRLLHMPDFMTEMLEKQYVEDFWLSILTLFHIGYIYLGTWLL
jgi:hypothetical protein